MRRLYVELILTDLESEKVDELMKKYDVDHEEDLFIKMIRKEE
ncbi:hypothetical protein [Rossellomorea marisflavi]